MSVYATGLSTPPSKSIAISGKTAATIAAPNLLGRAKSEPIPIYPIKAGDKVLLTDPVQVYIKYGKQENNMEAQTRVEAHFDRIPTKVRHKLAEAAINHQDTGLILAMGHAGYDFNASNERLGKMETHLTHALHENKPLSVRALLAAGADVNLRPERGNPPVQTALYLAESKNQHRLLQAILEARPALDEEQTEQVQKLAVNGKLKKLLAESLLTAAKQGNQPLIRYLVDTVKVDPNSKVGKWNASTVAAMNNRWVTANRLEEQGVPNDFRYRVVQFAYDMSSAKDNPGRREALLDFLTAKYSEAKPKPAKKKVKVSSEEDELPFQMD